MKRVYFVAANRKNARQGCRIASKARSNSATVVRSNGCVEGKSNIDERVLSRFERKFEKLSRTTESGRTRSDADLDRSLIAAAVRKT